MWLFTVHGFYSIVKKHADEWHVRARSKQDLDNLKKLARCRVSVEQSWPGSDYPWRMIVSRTTRDRIMEALGSDIEYTNFKSEVGRRPDQAGKLHAYHEIWALMAAHERGAVIR